MPSLFPENGAARDYQVRAEQTNTFVYTDVGEMSHLRVDTQVIRFGKASGYELVLTLKQWRTSGSATINWEAKLVGTGLWAFTQTESGTGSRPTPWLSRIDLDEVRLVVTGETCHTVAIYASAIRWYLDGGLKYENNTDVALTGLTGYDARENHIYASAIPNPGSVHLNGIYPACGPSETARQARTHGWLQHGWRWAPAGTTAWEYDEIEIVNRAVPAIVCPDGCTCDCPEDVPDVTIEEPITQPSWTITMPCEWNDENIVASEGTASCPCFGVGDCSPGGNVEGDLYSNRHNYLEQWSTGYFAPYDAPMEEHTYLECARSYCDGSPEGTPAYTCVTTVQDQDHTTCRTNSYVLSETIVKYCIEVTNPGCETPSCSMDFEDCTGLISRDCIYEAYREVTWTVRPGCPVAARPAYDVGQSMRHWRGYRNASRYLRLGKSANVPLSWSDTTQTPKVHFVRVLQARTRKDAELFVLYRDYTSGDLKLAKTQDPETAISAVVTIGAYTQGDIVWGRGGLLYVLYLDAGTIKAKVYDSQLALMASITTNLTGVADATIRAQEGVASGGAWKIACQHTVGGVVKIARAGEDLQFSGTFSLATSTQADICWTRAGLLYAYYYSAGTLAGVVYDPLLATVRTITTNITDLEDSSFDVHDSVRGGGQHRIVILRSLAGAVRTEASDDGVTFASA